MLKFTIWLSLWILLVLKKKRLDPGLPIRAILIKKRWEDRWWNDVEEKVIRNNELLKINTMLA